MDFDSLTTPEIRSWMSANGRDRDEPAVKDQFINAMSVLYSRGEPLVIVSPAGLPGPANRADTLPVCDSEDKRTESERVCAVADKTIQRDRVCAAVGKT